MTGGSVVVVVVVVVVVGAGATWQTLLLHGDCPYMLTRATSQQFDVLYEGWKLTNLETCDVTPSFVRISTEVIGATSHLLP